MTAPLYSRGIFVSRRVVAFFAALYVLLALDAAYQARRAEQNYDLASEAISIGESCVRDLRGILDQQIKPTEGGQ